MEGLQWLHSINGSLGYAVNARSDALGAVSCRRDLIARGAAKRALELLQAGSNNCKLWHRHPRTEKLKLTGVCDDAFKNIPAKYSVTGYVILL